MGEGNVFTGICLSTGGGIEGRGVWADPPSPTTGKQTVRILLECILVTGKILEFCY